MPMGQRILLPDAEEVVLDHLRTVGRDSLCMVLRAASTSGACPADRHGQERGIPESD
jgi:hypothetical protein